MSGIVGGWLQREAYVGDGLQAYVVTHFKKYRWIWSKKVSHVVRYARSGRVPLRCGDELHSPSARFLSGVRVMMCP